MQIHSLCKSHQTPQIGVAGKFMEDSGALRPKPLASHPSNVANPFKAREEGELTSSDEDALPASSTSAPSVSASDPAFPSKSTSDFGGKSSMEGVKSGKSISANQSGSTDIQSRKSLQIGTLKGLAKHHAPFKLSNPQWNKPHGVNDDNLVISFSDDDSGSDMEQHEPRKAFETDRRLSSSQALHAVNGSKHPSTMLPVTGRTTSNAGKMLPKKVGISQPFAPSVPRSNIPKPRNMWSSAVEQRPCSKNSNSVSKNLAIRGSGRSKSVDLSDNKLQDLRQLIALRENELKLKTIQLHKENSLEPCRDNNNINQSNPAPRRHRDISSDVHLEPKEPDAKRKRLSSDDSAQLSKGLHEKTSAKYVLQSKELAEKCNNPQDARIGVRGHHDGQMARTDLLQGSLRMQRPDEQLLPLFANPNATGQDAPGFSASCSLSDWMSKSRTNLAVSNPKQSVADVSLLNLPKSSGVERANQPSRLNETDPSSYSGNRATPVDATNKCNDQQDVQGKPDRFKYHSNLQVNAIQTSRNDASTSNHHNRGTNQGIDDTDVHSLFALEEFHDKKLEEAQEHRHRCEIEERNALKVYLKAQRALAEANAQCSYLYRKRELYSARLCSLLMDNPSLFLTSQQQEEFDGLWNFSNNVSEVNLDPIPSASDQLHAEHDAGNQVGYDSNVQSADGDVHQRFSPNVDGNHLGSEACSEPDASTSELLPHKNKETVNGVLSPSNDLNISSDECEEMCAIQGKKDIVGDSSTRFPAQAQESILLEAYLRSKLFSRLETITSSRRTGLGGNRGEGGEQRPDADTRSGTQMDLDKFPCPLPEKEHICEHGSASGNQYEVSAEGQAKDAEGTAKARLRMSNGLHSDVADNQSPDLGGLEEAERSLSTLQEVEKHSLNNFAERSHRTANLECSRPQMTDGNQLPSSIFRSAFNHVKGAYSTTSNDVCIFNQQDDICYPYNDKIVNCTEEYVRDSLVGGIDSYSCDYLIDPLWPLCMHELRGRCNNEECRLQHVRDYTQSNLHPKSRPSSADSVTGSSSNCSNQKGGEPSQFLTPPAYLVCVDSLKADSHTFGYILDRECGPSWQKIFSISLVVPSFLRRHLPSHEPVLHGNYGCIEIRGNPLYLQSRNDTMSLLQTDLSDYNQVLESALLILNQEIDKAVGRRKSLALLSRGLEADPASLHLWVVYLLIYYNDGNSADDDDMFSCAVKNREGSYSLWLMYIQSRKQLKDQFSAYERALSTLCRDAHAFDGDAMHASACILDMFLQMLHCFCMSGNVKTVIERIHRLTDGIKDPDSLLLFDILQCLEVSEKCVFWVCCAYLVIYKKLPDAIVGMFEFEKDISLIDWPCVHKTTVEKQLVYKLMEMAEDSMKPQIERVCSEKSMGMGLRAAHLFALNHVKLVAAVDSFESFKDILEKYGNQYSSCLEIVLLAARVCSQRGEGNSYLGFEEALSKWPKEVPGIQCIWNQFAEYALQNGGCDVGKEIMLRWSDSVSKAHCSQNRAANKDGIVDNNRDVDIEMFSSEASESRPSSTDAIFGLLNLSLYGLLHKDVEKAYLAADKAMKTAHDDFRHCIREHATFLLNYGSQVGKNVSLPGLLEILKSYIHHTTNSVVSEPLTRKFIQHIPKPRPRQLVRDMLYPVSPDFSAVNLVLETWFGPSLLPQKLNKITELVDFVEAVLELSPCNYPFAISICKLLLSKEIDTASTLFWASSLLVNTIYQSVPVPPEYVWAEAAGLLSELITGQELTISESFHRRALSVYPFSINLWKSFLRQSVSADDRISVLEAAKEKGIELPSTSFEEKRLEATKEK